MKKEFNIGDRVRVVADMERPYYMWVEKGDTGVIVEGESSKGFECVRIDGCANMDYVCVESKYLEADATYDHKTAFLSELKGLLGKYNAHLIAHKTDMPISVYFEGEDEPCVTIGKEVNKGCGIVITPDNIMEYDKE